MSVHFGVTAGDLTERYANYSRSIQFVEQLSNNYRITSPDRDRARAGICLSPWLVARLLSSRQAGIIGVISKRRLTTISITNNCPSFPTTGQLTRIELLALKPLTRTNDEAE